jgi:hypothetical protein
MKSVKISLVNDMGKRLYLTFTYFRRRFNGKRVVDSFYLTENPRWASLVPLKEARKWMREAKALASYDGDVIEKAEYLLAGKPTTLKAAGLR